MRWYKEPVESKDDAVQTLQDLIDQAMKNHGVTSGRALAELAAKHGQKIDRTQINSIRGGTYKSRPTKGLLEAVAWLAGKGLDEVYVAAGLPIPGPPFADELPPDVDTLGPRERHAVITVIRAFLGAAAEEGEIGGDTAANTPPGSGPGLRVVDDPPPGPFDDELDDLPPESDDPPPIGGRSTKEAARKKDGD